MLRQQNYLHLVGLAAIALTGPPLYAQRLETRAFLRRIVPLRAHSGVPLTAQAQRYLAEVRAVVADYGIELLDSP